MKSRTIIALLLLAFFSLHGAAETTRTLKPTSFIKTTGETEGLVLRIAFSDVPFNYPKSTWDVWFNKENGHTYRNICPGGSVRDYYMAQSNGQFRPHYTIMDVTLASTPFAAFDYEETVALALRTLAQTDPTVDFSPFDLDGDRVVDNITVLLSVDAGYDFTPCQSAFAWYPYVAVPTINGYTFNAMNYITERDYGRMLGIGTFIHELGHVMGFPDSYYQNADGTFNMNQWDIMNQGIYNIATYGDNPGSTPPNMNAYQTWALGWTTPTEITELGYYTLDVWNREEGTTRRFNSYFMANPDDPNDFYVFEYRSNATTGANLPLSKYDQPLPAKGMLIWHITYEAGNFNNTILGEHVKLICADNDAYDGLRTSDPWPGSANHTRFTSSGKPAFRWGLNEAGKPATVGTARVMLEAIREDNHQIHFRVATLPRPDDAGVEQVEAATPATPSSEPVYYTLQGLRVTHPREGQLLIRRTATATERIIYHE